MATFIRRLKKTLFVSTIINVAVFFFLISSLMFFWEFVRTYRNIVLAISGAILLVTIAIGWIKVNRLTTKIKHKAGYQ